MEGPPHRSPNTRYETIFQNTSHLRDIGFLVHFLPILTETVTLVEVDGVVVVTTELGVTPVDRTLYVLDTGMCVDEVRRQCLLFIR